jgi:hypothetical protein
VEGATVAALIKEVTKKEKREELTPEDGLRVAAIIRQRFSNPTEVEADVPF